MNICDLVGKRVLIKIGEMYSPLIQVAEHRVIEVSPSGAWVKLMNLNGNNFLKEACKIILIEELADLKAGKPDV
jgi:hypothetical protein